MLAVLGNTVPAQCVILQAGDDANLREYMQQWMIEQRLSAMFERLFTHWIAR
jgi:hypothetical protein